MDTRNQHWYREIHLDSVNVYSCNGLRKMPQNAHSGSIFSLIFYSIYVQNLDVVQTLFL